MPGGIIPGGGGLIPGTLGGGAIGIPIIGYPRAIGIGGLITGPLPGMPIGKGTPIGGIACIDLYIGVSLPTCYFAAPSPTRLAVYAGGASALIVTIFSPLSKTKPRARFISLSF